ncbi:hypothetical protein TorRG33x02_280930, partial [Trema orientale]
QKHLSAETKTRLLVFLVSPKVTDAINVAINGRN